MLKNNRRKMGRAGSGPEFRVNFGSGRVISLVGRVGLNQENWTHVHSGN